LTSLHRIVSEVQIFLRVLTKVSCIDGYRTL